MRDLHEIVDLYTLLNPRPAKTSTINRRVCADFDIVVDLNNSKLLDFFLAAIDHLKSKAVRANDRAAMDDHTRANAGALADRYPRINHASRSNYRFMTNVAPCPDHSAVTDLRTGFDDRVRLERDAFSELGTWIDNRAWMDTRRKRDRVWSEFEHDLLEGFCRIRYANLRGWNDLRKVRRNKNGGGARFTQGPHIFSIRKKTDFARSCFRERRSTSDFQRRITDQFTAEHRGQFFK